MYKLFILNAAAHSTASCSFFPVSEDAKYYLLNYEDLATGLFGGGSMDSLMERSERLYFTGTDYTINLIPIALVSAAVLGCEY